MRYAKKSLGQNFLIDSNIIKKIVNLTSIEGKNILEIGPGKGAITNEILKNKPRSLILIEKDYLIYKELKSKYINYENVEIYNKDFLQFDFEKALKKKTTIFGNLPYNVSSQILVKIIKSKTWPPKYDKVILMFQKEMADRIIGTFNTPKYGRLSILTNYRLEIIKRFNVSPNCFFPKPKITSSILFLRPKKKVFNDIKHIENLEKITNIFFSNKRKMINKSIKKIFNKDKLNLIKDLNFKSRPADLKAEKYYEITKLYEKK